MDLNIELQKYSNWIVSIGFLRRTLLGAKEKQNKTTLLI